MQSLDGMVMMTQVEHNKLIAKVKNLERDFKELEKSNEMLRAALLYATSKGKTKDVRVSRQDFLKIYNKALDNMFDIMDEHKGDDKTPDDVENDIYGYDVTVHWHGMYCNCSDGATPSNYIMPAIEACDDEMGGDEY